MKKISIALFAMLAVTVIMGSCKKEELPNPTPGSVTVKQPSVKFKLNSENFITKDTIFQKSMAKFNVCIDVSSDIDDVFDNVLISLPDRPDSLYKKAKNSYTFNTTDAHGSAVTMTETDTLFAKVVTKGGRTAEKQVIVTIIDDKELMDSTFVWTKNNDEEAVISTDEIGLNWEGYVKEIVNKDTINRSAIIKPLDGYTLYTFLPNYGVNIDELNYPKMVNLIKTDMVQKVSSDERIIVKNSSECDFYFIVKNNELRVYNMVVVKNIENQDMLYKLSGYYKRMD